MLVVVVAVFCSLVCSFVRSYLMFAGMFDDNETKIGNGLTTFIQRHTSFVNGTLSKIHLNIFFNLLIIYI